VIFRVDDSDIVRVVPCDVSRGGGGAQVVAVSADHRKAKRNRLDRVGLQFDRIDELEVDGGFHRDRSGGEDGVGKVDRLHGVRSKAGEMDGNAFCEWCGASGRCVDLATVAGGSSRKKCTKRYFFSRVVSELEKVFRKPH
jgi:hypothetical protein